MKKDSIYGPPKEIWDQKGKKQKEEKLVGTFKEIEEDDDNDEGYDNIQLRKYEKQKLKYYYAVVHLNTKKTAKQLYKEFNGFEFEDSNLRLKLSFIADDLDFP